MQKVNLNPEKIRLLDYIESHHKHIFITGRAGTGKSTLLNHLKENSSKNLLVCAPTGIAAINIGGQTIHSLFKFPLNFIETNHLKPDYKVLALLKKIDMLIIDEISMVKADLLDAVDYMLRSAHKTDLPFGGVQLVAFGDMYQLPPVISDEEIFLYTQHDYEGVYFFNAKVWQLAHLEIYELQEIFRQKDDSFKDILNAIRVGRLTPEILKTLNTRCSKPAMGMITLATTNATVASINEEKLNGLDDKEHTYMATISGDFDRNSYPTEEKLTLKVGAQIMMLKNDQDRRWVNGTIGRIFSLNKEDIKVFIDGKTYTVKPESWNKINYVLNEKTGVVEEQVIASFTQYPLRLAWAITIHKSQGQTYEKIYLDLGRGAFAHGQTYVALSRAVSLEGLFLARPIRTSDIILDPQIVNFMRSAKISTL